MTGQHDALIPTPLVALFEREVGDRHLSTSPMHEEIGISFSVEHRIGPLRDQCVAPFSANQVINP